MRNRLRFAEKVAGVSALALLGFLFLDWFGAGGVGPLTVDGDVTYYGPPVDIGGSGWDSLGWLALALCVLAILAGLALPLVFGAIESPVLPLVAAMAAMLLGILAVIALLIQVVLQPGDDAITDVLSGWWLGLLAAAGVARGGFLSLRDEYLPGVPQADVPLRPAPSIVGQ